jgi:hypothetical protein
MANKLVFKLALIGLSTLLNEMAMANECGVTIQSKDRLITQESVNGYYLTRREAPFKLVLIPGKPGKDYVSDGGGSVAIATYAQLVHESGFIIKSSMRLSGFDLGGKISAKHNLEIRAKMRDAKSVAEFNALKGQLDLSLDIDRPKTFEEAFLNSFPPCREVIGEFTR